MHELSIAVSLIEAATEELPRHNGARVTALHLRIGPLSGVVKDALRFAFDVAAEGTPLEGARLEIDEVALTGVCAYCAQTVQLAGPTDLRCPQCGQTTQDIVTGRELELKALELVDDTNADR